MSQTELEIKRLPTEYPLRDALAIYGKRLAVFFCVVVANFTFMGLVLTFHSITGSVFLSLILSFVFFVLLVYFVLFVLAPTRLSLAVYLFYKRILERRSSFFYARKHKRDIQCIEGQLDWDTSTTIQQSIATLITSLRERSPNLSNEELQNLAKLFIGETGRRLAAGEQPGFIRVDQEGSIIEITLLSFEHSAKQEEPEKSEDMEQSNIH